MKLLQWTQDQLDDKGLQDKYARRELEDVASQAARCEAPTSAPR